MKLESQSALIEQLYAKIEEQKDKLRESVKVHKGNEILARNNKKLSKQLEEIRLQAVTPGKQPELQMTPPSPASSECARAQCMINLQMKQKLEMENEEMRTELQLYRASQSIPPTPKGVDEPVEAIEIRPFVPEEDDEEEKRATTSLIEELKTNLKIAQRELTEKEKTLGTMKQQLDDLQRSEISAKSELEKIKEVRRAETETNLKEALEERFEKSMKQNAQLIQELTMNEQRIQDELMVARDEILKRDARIRELEESLDDALSPKKKGKKNKKDKKK